MKNALAIIAVLVSVLTLVAVLMLVNTPSQDAPKAGAVTSSDIQSPYFSFGGVRSWAYSVSMKNASTTCAIQSPAATTTLVAATAQVTVAPTTTPQFEIGIGSNAYSTTTSLAKWTFTANTFKSIVATSSPTTPTDGVISPLTYVNVKQGAGGGSFVPTGTCTAVFREL